MILQNPKTPRKLIIPIILILFFLIGFFVVQLKKTDFGFNFQLLKKEKIVNPILPPTEEEKLRNLLQMSGLGVETIKSLDNSFEATISGNLTVLFSKEIEYALQVASLQFILERSKIEGKIPSKIDLRFDKPVLTY